MAKNGFHDLYYTIKAKLWMAKLREDFPGKTPFLLLPNLGDPLPKLILSLVYFDTFSKVKKVAQTACRGRGNLDNAQKKGYFFSGLPSLR